MRRPVLAANWKMNHGPSEARAFVRQFLERYAARPDRTIIFFPPALSLTTLADALRNRADLELGIQNIWMEDKGPYTGETSAPMSRDAGARYALVGHSERRHVFGESDAEVAKKMAAAVRNGLTPILCVGEKLTERESGVTNDVVLRQLRVGIAALDREAIAGIAIAYEPVWAIGTGRNATPDDAAAVHGILRGALAQDGDRESAASIPILYGGRVNPANARGLLSASGVDVPLVGGASLDAETWSLICATSNT